MTSRDVAARAGVSQSTVSLVLSGKAAGRVGAATVAAVQRAAAELGYRPNAAARTLRTGRSGAVGLVVPDVTNPFFGLLLRGAQRAAREHGVTVVLVDLARDPGAGAASMHALQTAAVDGYLTFALDPGRELEGFNEPAVAIEVWDATVPCVRLDVEAGIEQAVDHLRGLGHARIGRLRSAADTHTFRARDRVIARLLGDDVPTARTEHDIESACRAAPALFGTGLTAVICDDDILAAGLCVAAREHGVRVPDDLSVVGFDDLDLARVLDPPLTTVAVDGPRLGAVALERLLEVMEGAEAGELVLPVELVVRGSTARPG